MRLGKGSVNRLIKLLYLRIYESLLGELKKEGEEGD